MKIRALLLTLLLGVIPLAESHAFVAITIAPPLLPVYVQPVCPVEGYIWTPGYWEYDVDSYYWVPGVWVAPPQIGYLWTPGYWGYADGFYAFHRGYWGPTVGFYGGVNYGFGYGGYGYYGGRWDGGVFRYNTAVTRVNTAVIHNTYVNRSVVNNITAARPSFNGPGGVAARPTAAQLAAAQAPHVGPTAVQAASHQTAMKAFNANRAFNHGNAAGARTAARSNVAAVANRVATSQPGAAHGLTAPTHPYAARPSRVPHVANGQNHEHGNPGSFHPDRY